MTEIAIYENKSLEELFAPLTKGQRDYLYLRLMDLPIQESLRIANLKLSSYNKVWRLDGNFKELEDYILTKKEMYAKEAFAGYLQNIGVKAQKVLESLVEKGLAWDTLNQGDKPYVFKAIELIAKLSPKGGGDKQGYEEMILKIRRGN